MKYDIRPATVADHEELSSLINSAYRGDSSRAGWTTEADFLEGQRIDAEMLRIELGQAGHTMLCLRETANGPIIGCVLLRKFRNDNGEGSYLGMLTVKPNLQDAGLGRALMTEAESFAKNHGAKKIVLRVIHLRDSLMEWYERQGYKKTGDTQPFPYGNDREGLPLRDDLHFVVFEKVL